MIRLMARTTAVDALEKMHRSGVRARDAVEAALSRRRLSGEDRAFLWELVLGVTRHRITLDRVLAGVSRVKLKKVHPRVLQVLRVGVYQLVYLDRIPDSAAVFESVEIVKRSFPEYLVKFANGCLRSATRAIEIKVGGALAPEDLMRAVPVSGERNCLLRTACFPDPAEDLAGSLAERFGYPHWLVVRLIDLHGEEAAEEILRAGNEPPRLSLHPTPGRLADLTREFGIRGIPHEVFEDPPEAVRLLGGAGPVNELPGYHQGWFTVQDRTAMRAAEALGPEPGERILDLCAAPGGKTVQMAQIAGPTAEVVAVDRDAKRLPLLTQNAGRLRLENVSVVEADLLAERPELGEPFDRVLLDAPCSNTGVLAKRVEARHRLDPDAVAAITVTQRALLEVAAGYVRPGGRLVYSTCALLPEENREAVEPLLSDGRFVLLEDRETLPAAGRRDGGYFASLDRGPA